MAGMTLRIALITIAEEIFRDQADKDYIAARSNYRMNLREQFLWSALQACEKYLKGILLFNNLSVRFPQAENAPPRWNKNAREFGHDLRRLFAAVNRIERSQFVWPKFLRGFLDYLTTFGDNRYLSVSTYTLGDELWRLDETVWTLRRYCQSFDFRLPGKTMRESRAVIFSIINQSGNRERPALFRPFGAIDGYLEQLLKGRHSSAARSNLLWHNLFFGNRDRQCVRLIAYSSSANPPQNRDWFTPRLRRLMDDYVKLPLAKKSR